MKGDFIIYQNQFVCCIFTLKNGSILRKFFKVPCNIIGIPEIVIKDNYKYLSDYGINFFKNLYKEDLKEFDYFLLNDITNELIFNKNEKIKNLKKDILKLNQQLQEQIRLNKRGPLKRFKDWIKKTFN